MCVCVHACMHTYEIVCVCVCEFVYVCMSISVLCHIIRRQVNTT